MAISKAAQRDPLLAEFQIVLDGVSTVNTNEVTPVEVILGESLLTPGLQTSVRCHSHVHSVPIKNLDDYKGKGLGVDIIRPVTGTMKVRQRLYRMDQRRPISHSVEEFVLHGCDQTLLNDGKTLVSKSWKCTTPSQVVNDVLNCVQPDARIVESSAPARDYIAENIHPYQVISQQANAALAAGSDPSFVHFMTYEENAGIGIHHFESLYTMTRRGPVGTFGYFEAGKAAGPQMGYGNPNSIMTHSFPCDFDVLSDILNGIDENGQDINSVMLFNPVFNQFSLLGNQQLGCGMGGGVVKTSVSNAQSAQQQNSCPDYSEIWLLKRQARMALLEQDKIALRVVVPWQPQLHAGQVIELNLEHRPRQTGAGGGGGQIYGSGLYLISSMTHNLKLGGFSTTTLDCVSTTVGQGGVL